MIKKIITGIIFLTIGFTTFKKITIFILCLVALWYIIRFCADIFWWGRDKDKW